MSSRIMELSHSLSLTSSLVTPYSVSWRLISVSFIRYMPFCFSRHQWNKWHNIVQFTTPLVKCLCTSLLHAPRISRSEWMYLECDSDIAILHLREFQMVVVTCTTVQCVRLRCCLVHICIRYRGRNLYSLLKTFVLKFNTKSKRWLVWSAACSVPFDSFLIQSVSVPFVCIPNLFI